jgi:hypothetical protein
VSVRGGAERACHAVFTFTEADVAFNLGNSDELTFKLTLHGDTSDETGEADAFARSQLRVIDAGIDAEQGTRAAGNLITGSPSYDGSGHYLLTGLTAGRMYRWTDGGAHDTSVTNGSQTVTVTDSVFVAQGTTVTLNGTAGTTVTAVVWYGITPTGDEIAAYISGLGLVSTLAGEENLVADEIEHTVTGLGLGSTPTSICPFVIIPQGGEFISCCLIAGTKGSGGFKVRLNAPCPNPATGYKLGWQIKP